MTDEEARKRRDAAAHVAAARDASGSIIGSGPGAIRETVTLLPSAWEIDREAWPLPARDAVFLGQALLELGQHLRRSPDWNAPAGERGAIARLIAEACSAGRLHSYTLTKQPGGKMARLSAETWTTGDWRAIVEACAIDQPSPNHWTDGGPAWVYLDSEQFVQLRDHLALNQPWRSVTQGGEAEAEAELEALAAAWKNGTGAIPVKVRWLETVKSRIGARPANRVWDKVADRHPGIRAVRGKSKQR
ncbi:MAG TPA: hypothetical protein VN814_01860, partial [Caulobacteraceae bacterium]|nr:hypothetical protein [Caulobacteraceae bacterium]